MSLPGAVRRRCDAVYVAKGGVLQTAPSITAFLVACEVEPDDRIIHAFLQSGGSTTASASSSSNNNKADTLPQKDSNNSPSKKAGAVGSSSPRGAAPSGSGGASPSPIDNGPPTSARLRLKPTNSTLHPSSSSLGTVALTTARRLQKGGPVSIEMADTSMTSMPLGIPPLPQSPTTVVPRTNHRSAVLGPPRISLDECYALVKECLVAQDRKRIVGNDEQLLSLAWSAFSGSATTDGTAKAAEFETQIQSFGLRCAPLAGSPVQPASSPTAMGVADYDMADGPTMNFGDMISLLTIDKDILQAVRSAKSVVSLPASLLRTLTLEEQAKAQRVAKVLFRFKLMLRTTLAFRRANKSFDRTFSSPTMMAPLPSSGRLKALRGDGGGVAHHHHLHDGCNNGGSPSSYKGGRVQTREERRATIRRLSLFDHDAIGSRCRKHSHSHSVVDSFSPSRGRSPVAAQSRSRSPIVENSATTTTAGSPGGSPSPSKAAAPLPRIQPGFSSVKLEADYIRERGSLLPPLERDRRCHQSIVTKLEQQLPPSSSSQGRGPRLLSSRHDNEHDALLSPSDRLQFWKKRLDDIASSPTSDLLMCSHPRASVTGEASAEGEPLYHHHTNNTVTHANTTTLLDISSFLKSPPTTAQRSVSVNGRRGGGGGGAKRKQFRDFSSQVGEEEIVEEVRRANGGGKRNPLSNRRLAEKKTRKAVA